MRRKVFLWFMLLGSAMAAQAQDAIRIGEVNPITGSIGQYGTTCHQGIKLAIDQAIRIGSRRFYCFDDISSSSISPGGLTAGMTYFSSAQAPRSICLQRREQKGRYLFCSDHSTLLPQVGQSTSTAMESMIRQKLQRVSSNGTSPS